MAATPRRFLVVLPVRNGGEILKTCVRSILSQSDATFRLIVLDNASVDGTVAWLRESRDPRVEVYESSAPLSIEDNWARILEVQNSDEYVTIIGHDDVLDSRFLFSMSSLIDKFPDAKLYHSQFRLIDANNRVIRNAMPSPLLERSYEFLSARLSFRRDSFGTGYVFKLKNFIDVGGIPRYKKLMFADDALWIKLMRGSFKATLQDVTFSYRVHSGSTSYAPERQVVFEALHSYLRFLVDQAQEDPRVHQVVCDGMQEYLKFYLRWAYFSLPVEHRHSDEFVEEIQTLTHIVEPVIGLHRSEYVRACCRSALFGWYPRTRWMLWRTRRWARSRGADWAQP